MPQISAVPHLVRALFLVCAALALWPAAASAAEVYVDVRATEPRATGLELEPGEQARIRLQGSENVCVEPNEGCLPYGAGGAPYTCTEAGQDCLAPGLPEFAVIARLGGGPWRLVGEGPAYLTGTGEVQLAINVGEPNLYWGRHALSVDRIAAGDIQVEAVTSSPATVGPGAQDLPITSLPVLDPLGDTTGDTLAEAPLRSTPLRSTPLRSTPLRSTPLRSTPLRSTDLAHISLSAIPLRSTSWAEVLAGTPLDVPAAALTFGQLFELDPLPAKLEALTLADLDLARTPLRSTSLAGLLLAGVPVGQLAGLDEPWCDPRYQDPGCSADFTLMQLEASRGTYGSLGDLLLSAPSDITGSPLAAMRLSDLNLARTPLAGRTDLGGYVTVGALVRALPLPGLERLTLGDLLPAVVAPADLPFEAAPLADLLSAAPSRAADRVSVSATVHVPCTTSRFDLDVSIPAGARLVRGTAAATSGAARYPLANPTGPAAATSFTLLASAALQGSCPGAARTVVVTFDLDPPPRLGAPTVEVVAHGDDLDQSAGAGTGTRVEDAADPGDTPATAGTLTTDALRTGYVATGDDADLYRLTAPAAGSTVTIELSHLPADFDLTVSGPPVGIQAAPLRSTPLRSTPLRSTPIGDELATSGEVRPALLQDVPLRSTEVAGAPLRSTSLTRGLSPESATLTIAPSDAGKDLWIRVTGFNGARSDEPYVLQASVQAPVAAPQCRVARTFPATLPAAGAFPSLPLAAATKTIFLVNQRRLAQLYGAASVTSLRGKLDALAARPEVRGAVVPVESDPQNPTAAAYAAWDASPCSGAAANDVAVAIRRVLGRVTTGLNDVRHVVVIGGDEVIPQGRVLDGATVANEREEAGNLVFGGRDTALSRSLRDGFLLTDDVYGDFAPQAALAGQSFVPDVALGRLVETPAEIIGQLDAYTAANGALRTSSAYVSGYDFLTDGAEAITSALRTLPGTETAVPDDADWTAEQAAAALNRASGGITSVNAHYDHYRALPAAAWKGLVPDLLGSGQVDAVEGSFLFTAGCHAGLSVPNVGATGTVAADAPRLLDWPQKNAARRVVYVANTTYGYGDTAAVAYSERLLELLAQGIASQRVTAGQALMLAKQRYAAEQQVPGVYEQKASMGLTFYGLPFFRVGSTGQEGAATLPTSPAGGTATASTRFAVDPQFQEVIPQDDPETAYWVADGQAPQVTHHRPITARVTVDVTSTDPAHAGLAVHGAVIDEGATDDGYGPGRISQPVADSGGSYVQSWFDGDGLFPNSIARTTRHGSSTGLRDQLVLAVGQSQGEYGTQRRWTHLAGSVLRSSSTDFSPPRMTDITASVEGGVVRFSVRALDTDVVRGVILVQGGYGESWSAVELTRDGDLWTGQAPVSSSNPRPEYFVQLVDAAGNVGVSTNKGASYRPVPPARSRVPALGLSPRRPDTGWYTGPVTVRLDDAGREDTTFEVSVDGRPPVEYTGPFTVTGDGRHTVRFTGDDGSSGGVLVPIDLGGPVVTPRLSPAPSPEGFVAGPVTVTWTCADAGTGVASCPTTSTKLTAETAGTVVTSGAATDRAGNTSTGKVTVAVDLKAPTGAVNPYSKLGTTTTGSPPKVVKTVTGTAADTLAGVRSVKVTYTSVATPKKTTTVDAAVSCSATNRRSCTWAAVVPAVGSWRTTAVVTDRAGRTASLCRTDTLVIK